jgi:hypothetical protein
MKIEDEVKFANVTEVFVENLYERLHELQDNELVLILIDNGDEVETGETFINNFEFLVVDEIAHFGVPRDHHLVDLPHTRITYFKTRCFSA